MAQFSSKERLIARLLTATPRLKKIAKRCYISLNYLIHRKGYRSRVLIEGTTFITIPPVRVGDETFFGYYDHSPENRKGYVIYNETAFRTSKKPTAAHEITVRVLSLKEKAVSAAGKTQAYTWQQGSRAQWISDYKLIYNFFTQGAYKSAVVDITDPEHKEIYDYPVQDAFGSEYFLSINYERVMRLRPDYGYRNLPLLSDRQMADVDEDGIWKIDFKTRQTSLVVPISELIKLKPVESFRNALHKVNHVMISPDGTKFIFIHRWYNGQRRHDRLILSDFKTLRVIADEDMVSHMCWFNDTTLFGYLRVDGDNGFYFINIINGDITPCNALNEIGNGDGHPSVWNEWIVVDTYPDKSRMQHLYLFDSNRNKVFHVLEVFQGLNFQGESRCDLHPRFSDDGRRVYFDTVCNGSRRLAFIDVSSITSRN